MQALSLGLSGLRSLISPQHENVDIASLQSLNLIFFFLIYSFWLYESDSEINGKMKLLGYSYYGNYFMDPWSPKIFEAGHNLFS